MTNIEHVRKELLTYLSNVPNSIDQDPACIGQIAVSLGNALLWIMPLIEPHTHRLETPLGERPETNYALGKQCRAVGLKYWDAKKPSGKSKVMAIQETLLTIDERLTRLEAIGGAQ